MATSFGICMLVASAIGTFHSSHDGAKPGCGECRDESTAVAEQVAKLRSANLWVARRKAARALRGYRWERHPEAVEALADAVRGDRQCLVRQEAADSLGRMKPCMPEAHEALAHAAASDSSLIARHAARKALRNLPKACVEPCDVCEGEGLVGDEVPPIGWEPGLPGASPVAPASPESSLEPLGPTSLEVPASPSIRSPFAPRPDAPIVGPPPLTAPRIDPDVARPLAPPSVPMDRYNPRPYDPPPVPLDIPSPRPAWPAVSP